MRVPVNSINLVSTVRPVASLTFLIDFSSSFKMSSSKPASFKPSKTLRLDFIQAFSSMVKGGERKSRNGADTRAAVEPVLMMSKRCLKYSCASSESFSNSLVLMNSDNFFATDSKPFFFSETSKSVRFKSRSFAPWKNMVCTALKVSRRKLASVASILLL